jgi:hypothetical protein
MSRSQAEPGEKDNVFVLFTLRVKPSPHAEREEYIGRNIGKLKQIGFIYN